MAAGGEPDPHHDANRLCSRRGGDQESARSSIKGKIGRGVDHFQESFSVIKRVRGVRFF